jgi:DNA-binding NtrC family response regulator
MKTIFLVEDDTAVAEMMETILRRAGHQVLTARDIHEARAAWTKAKASVDVVLCDHFLGQASGAELVQEFRSDRPDLNVIMCSGAFLNGKTADVRYLMKPFTAAELLAAVERDKA